MQPGTLTSPPSQRGRIAAVAGFLLVVSLSSPACAAELYVMPHLIVPTTLHSYMALAGDVDGDASTSNLDALIIDAFNHGMINLPLLFD